MNAFPLAENEISWLNTQFIISSFRMFSAESEISYHVCFHIFSTQQDMKRTHNGSAQSLNILSFIIEVILGQRLQSRLEILYFDRL